MRRARTFGEMMAVAVVLLLLIALRQGYELLQGDRSLRLEKAWVSAALHELPRPDGVRDLVCGLEDWEPCCGGVVEVGGRALIVFDDHTTEHGRWRATARILSRRATVENFELLPAEGP